MKEFMKVLGYGLLNLIVVILIALTCRYIFGFIAVVFVIARACGFIKETLQSWFPAKKRKYNIWDSIRKKGPRFIINKSKIPKPKQIQCKKIYQHN